jgi:hypothetical protein
MEKYRLRTGVSEGANFWRVGPPPSCVMIIIMSRPARTVGGSNILTQPDA